MTATKDRIIAAYQKAFNKVDDYMEYRGMSKDDFKRIAERLTQELAAAHLKHVDDKEHVCCKGHDLCHTMTPGPECPYCEVKNG